MRDKAASAYWKYSSHISALHLFYSRFLLGQWFQITRREISYTVEKKAFMYRDHSAIVPQREKHSMTNLQSHQQQRLKSAIRTSVTNKMLPKNRLEGDVVCTVTSCTVLE